MRHQSFIGLALLLLFPAACAWPAENSPLPTVAANDNRTPAGSLGDGSLNLRLEVRQGRWYPESESGPYRDVYAFAEEGHAPQSSGPLLRVPQGTRIHVSVRNALPIAARIYGLHSHPGSADDALRLAPGETQQLDFLAGDPGTYLYWATTRGNNLEQRDDAETLLSGAFVVDPPDVVSHDRIFVISIWTRDRLPSGEILSINGKSWPYTERLNYKAGDAVHWRVLNPSATDHAMHLHGFYFKVDGVGDGEHYSRYSEEQRRLAVTEHIPIGHTFDMTWNPERAGNWLFHCHMVSHISTEPAPSEGAKSPAHLPSAEIDHGMGMTGLVMGITVSPGAVHSPLPAPAVEARKLQLVISENPEKTPSYKLDVLDPLKPNPPEQDMKTSSLLGPPIFLTRGQPAEIEIKNLSNSPTTIHWHGIELESYYDGVAGWTGSGQMTSPPVAPGTSFIARMTPPRAGTFIYHTHWHDNTQVLNGLYGPLIVLEPGQRYDPDHDRTFVFSAGRYAPFGYLMLVNGHPEPDPVELHPSTRYRLRLINITDDISMLRVRLMNHGVPVQWKVIAKDGADLPPAQLQRSSADLGITVGETYDVEYQADTPGVADLEIRDADFPTPVTIPLKFVEK